MDLSPPRLVFRFARFNELNLDELYEIMAARQEVFVTEQKIMYVDCDNKDQKAWHLIARCKEHGEIAAYLRVLDPGVKSPHPAIGRVLTRQKYRLKGYGRQLMAAAIEYCDRAFGKEPLVMSAQAYLQKFYEAFGFKVDSEVYMEEGIEHIHMTRIPKG